MTSLTNVEKRRAVFTLCAHFGVILTVNGKEDMLFSISGSPLDLFFLLILPCSVCAWVFALKSMTGTRVDIYRGMLASLKTITTSLLLFGVGVGVYAFVINLRISGFNDSMNHAFYLPAILIEDVILFFGGVKLIIAVIIGGLIYAPVFQCRDC